MIKHCIVKASIWDIAFNGWWCKVENLVMSMPSKFKRVQHNSYIYIYIVAGLKGIKLV